MIEIQRFTVNMLQENCYVVNDETKEAVIIDCGAFYDEERQAVLDYLRDRQLRPVHLIATHGHFDHNFGNDTIYEQTKLQPEIPAADEWLAEDIARQYRELMGMNYHRPTPPLGKMIHEGDRIRFGNHEISVIATPGHTPGSVSFYIESEKACFTGDTLFKGSIGRTDFERGSWEDMCKSLQQIAKVLPAETSLYPGHGPVTTMGDELRSNPYLTQI